jgi:large subunit ribosomal protein L30e
MVIKQAVDTGDIVIGTRRTEKAVKKKTAKMLVIASNCPEFAWLKDVAVKIHRYKGTSLDLGAACGKPYSVSMLAVLSPGESTIMSL